MAARGGRGGRGRGGKPSPFTPQLMAGLNYNDIIKQSKEGHVHYPERQLPETDLADRLEEDMGMAYNRMVEEQKYTPYWLDAPRQVSSRVPLYSDQFNRASGAASGSSNAPLAALKALGRELPRDLLPPASFGAVFDQPVKKDRANGTGKGKNETGKLLDRAEANGDEESEPEEEGEAIEEDDEYEDENDYGDNYFDGGEDDGGEGGDALGGGGDEDGGTFD